MFSQECFSTASARRLTNASGFVSASDSARRPPSPLRLVCQPPFLVASSQEATTSLGSRIRSTIPLSGRASMIRPAPTDPPGSLTARYPPSNSGNRALAPSRMKFLMERSQTSLYWEAKMKCFPPWRWNLWGSKTVPTLGSNHTSWPSGSSIIAASQVLPVRPVPKIQIMFSGVTPPAERPSLPARSTRAPRVTPASRPRVALILRATPETLGCLKTGTRSLLRGAPDRVELSEEGACHPFDYLGLPCGQIFPPAARLRLAVELALALLFARDLLPGVLLHRAHKIGLLHGHLQIRVDALHSLQSIRPQFLVTDEDLEPSVGVVGLLGVSDVPHVPPCLALHEGIRPALGQRRRLLLAAFPHQVGGPGPFLVGVEVGGDDIPRITDEQDHTTLGQGLHEQRSPHRALRLLDDQVPSVFGCYPGETRGGRGEDEPPEGAEPDLPVAGPEDEVLILAAMACPLVVEVAEQMPHKWLVPPAVAFDLAHDGAEPGASRPRRTEHPDEVLRPHAAGLLSCGWHPSSSYLAPGVPDHSASRVVAV